KEHAGTWDRLKAAMRRDWEQTKADFTSNGKELNQGVGDTVKQIAGSEPIPGPNTPNADDEWKKVETEYRFGVGAHQQYSREYRDWNDELDGKLSRDWDELKYDRAWDAARPTVRRAWDRTRSSS